MSFERYISDFGSFESALLDYGVENIPKILVMNDEGIMRERMKRIFRHSKKGQHLAHDCIVFCNAI